MTALAMDVTVEIKPSLALILDDREYERVVLRLEEDQKEAQIQDALLREAKEAGMNTELWKLVMLPTPRLQSLPVHAPAQSASTSPSPPQRQRSNSIDSHKTCSTRATSAYSRPSVDHRSSSSTSTSTSPSKRFLLNFPQTSYDSRGSISNTIPSIGQHSTTSLGVQSNRSSISIGGSERSPKKRSTIQRGLSKLSKLKRFHAGGSHDG